MLAISLENNQRTLSSREDYVVDLTFLDTPTSVPSSSKSSSSSAHATKAASVVHVPKKKPPTVADSLNFGARNKAGNGKQQGQQSYASMVAGKAKINQPARFSPAIEAAMSQVRPVFNGVLKIEAFFIVIAAYFQDNV